MILTVDENNINALIIRIIFRNYQNVNFFNIAKTAQGYLARKKFARKILKVFISHFS